MLRIDDLAHSNELTEEQLQEVRGGFFREVVYPVMDMVNGPTYGEVIREAMENVGK